MDNIEIAMILLVGILLITVMYLDTIPTPVKEVPTPKQPTQNVAPVLNSGAQMTVTVITTGVRATVTVV